jgi:hypothetical protein
MGFPGSTIDINVGYPPELMGAPNSKGIVDQRWHRMGPNDARVDGGIVRWVGTAVGPAEM